MTNETDMLENRAKFAAKLAAVQMDVTAVPNDAWNDYQKYAYTSAEAILAMARPLFAKHDLAVLPSTRGIKLSGEDKQKTALVKIDLTLIDTKTGYSESSPFYGFGQDTSDKAVPKAYTMALKYGLRVLLMIDLPDDAEDGQKQPPRQNAPRPAAPAPAQPKPAAPPPAPKQTPPPKTAAPKAETGKPAGPALVTTAMLNRITDLAGKLGYPGERLEKIVESEYKTSLPKLTADQAGELVKRLETALETAAKSKAVA